jgi:hypothetical protein
MQSTAADAKGVGEIQSGLSSAFSAFAAFSAVKFHPSAKALSYCANALPTINGQSHLHSTGR